MDKSTWRKNPDGCTAGRAHVSSTAGRQNVLRPGPPVSYTALRTPPESKAGWRRSEWTRTRRWDTIGRVALEEHDRCYRHFGCRRSGGHKGGGAVARTGLPRVTPTGRDQNGARNAWPNPATDRAGA